MPRFVDVISNFSVGELDPLLRARIDLDTYNNALAKATNVLIQPQGGLRRRPGTRHILELPNSSTPSAANGVRLVPFQFAVNDSYMLCFTHQRMHVIKNGAVVTNINASGNDYLAITAITSDMVDDMCWTQSADTLIVVHPDLPPQRIVRGATDADWTASAITFDSIPRHAFTITTSTPPGTLTPSSVSGNITLTSSFTPESGTAQAGASTTITLAAGASATNDAYKDLYITTTGGTGSGQVRRITGYVGSTKVATVASAWTVTPNNTTTYTISAFVSGLVDQYVNASPQGRARIVRYVSGTVVDAITEYPFFNSTAVAAGAWQLETGYEAAWSATRGWPRTVTFHEGRLFFGGSKSRPSTLWGSKVALFFDFVPNESLDDDAIEATLDTNDLNIITDIISARDFQVFTTGGEFFVPQQSSDPITPLTLAFKNVSRNGIKPGTRVQSVDSGTVYIQRQGKSLNEFVFTNTQETYITQRISLLSGHLLKSPQRIALRKASSTEEADLLMMTNATDGTLAAFSMMRSQQITSPSEFTTDGDFIDVGVDVNTIYVVTRRVFDGTARFFVEQFDNDLFTDCAFTGAAASGATGLPHIGKSLNVITDGVTQPNETVSAGGAVTFDRPSLDNFEVGLPISVLVRTMPVELRLQTGNRLGFKKRIVEINAVVQDTQNLVINNQPIAFRLLDNPILDEPVPEFTGIKRVNGVLGYSREAAIEVSQTLPLKMNLLGLDYRVAVTGGT